MSATALARERLVLLSACRLTRVSVALSCPHFCLHMHALGWTGTTDVWVEFFIPPHRRTWQEVEKAIYVQVSSEQEGERSQRLSERNHCVPRP